MMTSGFGLLCFEIAKEWNNVTGGVMGLSGIPSPTLKSLNILGFDIDGVNYFRVLLVVTAVVLWLLRNFVQSHHGRAFFAIHSSVRRAAPSVGPTPSAQPWLAWPVRSMRIWWGIWGLTASTSCARWKCW